MVAHIFKPEDFDGNIQRAIDEASQIYNPGQGGSSPVGIVELEGSYQIEQPLICTSPISFQSYGKSRISYYGPETNDPILKWYVDTNTDKEGIEGISYLCAFNNITFVCRHQCRGPQIIGLKYGCQVINFQVWHPRQVGIDAIACWGSSWRNVHVRSARGICFRAWGFNSCEMVNWKLSGTGVRHSSSSFSDTTALHEYIRDYGFDAAKKYYGEDLVEDWPDTNDQSLQDWSGNWVQTPADHRASVVIARSGLSTYHTICFEGLHYGPYPALSLMCPISSVNYTSWRDLRFEGNHLTGPKIRVGSYCRNNLFESIALGDANQANSECLVEFAGPCQLNTVRQVYGAGLSKAVVRFLSDYVHQNRVEDVSAVSQLTGNYRAPVPAVEWSKESEYGNHSNIVNGVVTPLVVKNGEEPSVAPPCHGWFNGQQPAQTVIINGPERIVNFVDGTPGQQIIVIVEGDNPVRFVHSDCKMWLKRERDKVLIRGSTFGLVLGNNNVWYEFGNMRKP